MGRLTRDPDCRYSRSITPRCIAQYTLAVPRKYKKQGQSEADFINCRAFSNDAEFAKKYFKKGMRVAITGRLQVHVSNTDGTRRYYTEVIVEEQDFAESKAAFESRVSNNQGHMQGGQAVGDGFVPVGEDDDLPF